MEIHGCEEEREKMNIWKVREAGDRKGRKKMAEKEIQRGKKHKNGRELDMKAVRYISERQ